MRARRYIDNPVPPVLSAEPPEWMRGALCAQVDPDLWFPEQGGGGGRAKSVCAECPVTSECLVYGMDDQFGVYGGLTARERRGLRRGAAA